MAVAAAVVAVLSAAELTAAAAAQQRIPSPLTSPLHPAESFPALLQSWSGPFGRL